MSVLKNEAREKISKHFDDRVPAYLDKMLTQKPIVYFKEVRLYWFLGISFNLIALVMISLSVFNVLTENFESPLKLVRVDGIHVIEASDIRRDVLLKNSLKRASIRAGEVD
jgi:hypothetical protein